MALENLSVDFSFMNKELPVVVKHRATEDTVNAHRVMILNS